MANDSNKPILTEAQINAVAELYTSGKLDEAIAEIKSLNKDYPNVPLLFNILGACYQAKGLLIDSAQMFETATKIKPDYAEAHFNLGVVLKASGKTEEAIECYKKAIYLVPNYPAAHNNLGNIYKDLNQLDDAVKSYETAIAIKPDYAEAYFNLGTTYKNLNKLNLAVDYYKKAITLKVDYADAYNNLGIVLKELKLFDEALSNYELAYSIKPEINYILGPILQIKKNRCSWNLLSSYLQHLEQNINLDKKGISPFVLLGMIDDVSLQQKNTERWVNEKHPRNNILPILKSYSDHKKIRLGYFSADFREHPVSDLIVELLEVHNRDQFEIHAFSCGKDTKDKMNLRIKASVDHFHNVHMKPDKDVAMLVRSYEIDIAIDLGGFTQGNRTEIFAMLAAPIQVCYLGYAGTMGADYMDYLICDRIVIPEDKQNFYSENLAYLPNSYMANDSKIVPSEGAYTRKNFELPAEGFVFCCFNSTYKITPETFTGWMNILSKVDGSVLWIYVSDNTAMKNLKKEAQKLGINPNRLIFASFMHPKDHLNRIQSADLFLDTLPYNAHTTTSDALRVGLPVLTRIGESFTSRVAASLLNAVNLPELITSSQEEYEALAIELATNPDKLKIIKDKLALNLPTAPLYDTALFTQHIESAYKTMYERHHQGLKPEHIYVEH